MAGYQLKAYPKSSPSRSKQSAICFLQWTFPAHYALCLAIALTHTTLLTAALQVQATMFCMCTEAVGFHSCKAPLIGQVLLI